MVWSGAASSCNASQLLYFLVNITVIVLLLTNSVKALNAWNSELGVVSMMTLL